MKSTEIRAQIDKLLRDKDAITKQLNEAKRRAKESGDYSDADWFRRAEAAERMASRQINRLQADLGAALKAERQQQHTARELTFERAFVRFAREVLPRETYDRLVRDASAQAHQPAGVAPAMDLQPPVDNAFVAPGCELFSSMPPVAAATAAQPERWRYVKTGATYTEVGRGLLKDEAGDLGWQSAVIYRSEADGAIYVRPVDQFNDGRFERIAGPAAGATGE